MSYIINMKYAILIIMMALQVLAFDKQDTIWTNKNEYSVRNYINSNIDTNIIQEYFALNYTDIKIDEVMIHASTDTYTNGIKTKTNILWGDTLILKRDTLNPIPADSMTVEYYEGYHYVFTWRAGIVHTQIAYFDSIQEINTDEDTRKVVKQKVKSNIVRYNSYEVRTFCNRIVELYYLDSEKVYSVYTEMYCNEPTESEPDTNSTHHYLNPIG